MKYLTQKRHSNEPSLQGFLRYYVSFSFHNSPKKAREGSLPTTVILPASFFQKPSRSHSTLPQLTTQKRASAFCSGNTLWAVRASFEIQHLRRLSRGSAGPREHSRSWWLAQSCPAHVAPHRLPTSGASVWNKLSIQKLDKFRLLQLLCKPIIHPNNRSSQHQSHNQ